MSTIEKGPSILTLINVFTVAPERQQELVTLLIDATHQTMKHLPGFVSANIHRSLDGKKVVNYAQWERSHAEKPRSSPSHAIRRSTGTVRPDLLRSLRHREHRVMVRYRVASRLDVTGHSEPVPVMWR